MPYSIKALITILSLLKVSWNLNAPIPSKTSSLQKEITKSNNPFFIRINDNRFINRDCMVTYLDSNDINVIDTENHSLPLTSSDETKLLKKIFLKCKKFAHFGKCNTGEIDMTFCKEAFSANNNHAVLLKGAIIDRYLLRKKMSQGEIVFIDEKKLAEIRTVNKNLKNKERILKCHFHHADKISYCLVLIQTVMVQTFGKVHALIQLLL